MTELRIASSGVVPQWNTGWRLQRALAHAGIPAGDMAIELQVSRATVSRWLNGKGPAPRSVYLRRWAEITGVSFEWLCHGDTNTCVPRPPRKSRSGGFNLTTNLTPPGLGLAA